MIYTDEVGTISLTTETLRTTFADGLLVYKPISQQSDFQAVQEDITEVDKWFTTNHLSIKVQVPDNLEEDKASTTNYAFILNGHIFSQVDIHVQVSWNSLKQ